MAPLANMETTIKLPPNSNTCLLEIVTTVNNVHSPELDVAGAEPEAAAKPLISAAFLTVRRPPAISMARAGLAFGRAARLRFGCR